MKKLFWYFAGAICGLLCLCVIYFLFIHSDAPDELIIDDSNYVQLDESQVELYWKFYKEPATIIRVIDGDTYVVDLDGSETTIRLIGVDTPESVAPEEYLKDTGKQNTDKGKQVSEIMAEKLPAGTVIYIRKGTDDTDKYGRTLVYAWFSDGTMIQDFLLVNGYADTMPMEPNIEYKKHFEEIRKKD